MPDVETPESSPEAEVEEQPTGTSEAESAPDKKAGEAESEEKKHSVPLKTYLEQRQANKELRERLEAIERRFQQDAQPKPSDKPAKLDAERKAAIDELLVEMGVDPRKVDKVTKWVEAQEAKEADRNEAMLETAVETVQALVKEHGLPSKQGFVDRLGYHVMSEIREDPKLMRRWSAGDSTVVRTAFDRYMSDYVGELRKGTNGATIATKRAVSKLPTLPAGGSGVSPGPPKRKEGDHGITKNTHDEAWNLMQRLKQEVNS